MYIYNDADYAVKFNDSVDFGLGPDKEYPFIYNFVHSNDDTWTSERALGLNNLIGIGPQVGPGAHIQLPIILDPDFNYKLFWIQYTAYWYDAVNGYYHWYEPVANWGLDNFQDYQSYIGTPLRNSLRVSLNIASQNTVLYGTFNLDPQSNNNQFGWVTPQAVHSIEGYDYGFSILATPYFCAKNGLIMIEIYNTHTIKTLVVGGCIYGLKVRL